MNWKDSGKKNRMEIEEEFSLEVNYSFVLKSFFSTIESFVEISPGRETKQSFVHDVSKWMFEGNELVVKREECNPVDILSTDNIFCKPNIAKGKIFGRQSIRNNSQLQRGC